jgi:cold shock CspA family protein
MPQGKIKFITDKGYGFITTAQGDVFFHATRTRTPIELLQVVQQIEFVEAVGRDGRSCAIEVEQR